MTMRHDELVSKFSQSVGVEKAADIVEEALSELGIEPAESYENRDVRDVCEVIQHRNSGYVSVIANELRVHKQAEERFEALLENIPDPAVVVGFDDGEPVVTSVNAAFESAFGYGSAVAGERLLDLIVPSDATDAARAEARDQWMMTGSRDEREVERETAEGEVRTFLCRSVVVTRETGEVEGYGVYTDITDRKRREQQLEHQNEQLERLVNVVSHDLRNPLSVANGHAELLLERCDDGTVAEHAEAIVGAQDRMETLIEDLLTLARQGRRVGETDAVSLERVCRDAWANVATGDAALVVEADGWTVEADRERLCGLFENLFRNAVEHGGDGLEVRVGTVSRGAGGDGFFVEDDGRGIPEDVRDDVLERGFTTNESGTGFGLSIVESIAEAHGWEVSVTESEDGGARFEITGVVRE